MRRCIGVLLCLAFAAMRAFGGTEPAKSAEGLKREAPMAANSNAGEIPIPQLSANTNGTSGVPLMREARGPAALVAASRAVATPASADSRRSFWIVVAAVVVMAASYLVNRLLSRSGRS
jgi:hypothetical protein